MPPVTKKRNVKSRDRTGCVTCRTRRLKCGEEKPECNICIRLGVRCGGYLRGIVFKDQTELMKKKHHDKDLDRVRTQDASMEARPSGETRLRRMTGALPSHRSPPHHNRTSTPHATQNLSDHEPFLFQFENERHIAEDMELSRARTFSPAFSHTPDSAHATDSGSQAQFDADDYQFAEASSGPEALSGNSATLNSIDLWPEPPVEMDNDDQMGAATTLLGLRVVPKATPISIAPPGLMESAIFAEDMIYYHHLRDVPPLGILSNLSLDSIFDAEYLDSTFFHAALALSALDISISGTSESHASLAGLHALEHFVVALSTVGKMKSSAEQAAGDRSGSASTGGNKQQRAICWMATVLLLAQFELQRGQMGPWYTHSRGAIAFLTQNLQVIRQSSVGRLLIRSFSRIAALLDIYDRVFSIHTRLSSSDVSTSLFESLTQSPFPSDRLLYIIPRVIQLEEEWRSNPESKMRWEDQAGTLLDELEDWKSSLEMCDVPCFDDEAADNSQHTGDVNSSTISPLRLPKSPNPTKATTHYMHYLVSILRLKYPLHTVQSIPPCAEEIVLMVCRLAAGVPVTSCAAVNAYGHGMLPALMNIYYISKNTQIKAWIRKWLRNFSRDREGIWNVRHAERLLAYVDEEYSRNGRRSDWSIIKVRMVDLETHCEASPLNIEEGEERPDKLAVEIYSKSKRGWSIDFVELD